LGIISYGLAVTADGQISGYTKKIKGPSPQFSSELEANQQVCKELG